ncbi:hypothetical protein LCGC14_1562990, partial [marine sediment metagenome]
MNYFNIEGYIALSEEKLKEIVEKEALGVVQELFKLLNNNFQKYSNAVSILFHKMEQIAHKPLEKTLILFLKKGHQLDHMFKLGIIEYISSEGLIQALSDSDSNLFDSIISYLIYSRTSYHIARLFYRIRNFTPISNDTVTKALIKYFEKVGIDLFFQTKIFENILQEEEFIALINAESVNFIEKFIKLIGESYEFLRDYGDFFNWMTYDAPEVFFEKIREATPNHLEGKILNDLKREDKNKFLYILHSNLLRFVRLKQVISLLSDEKSNFFNLFLEIIKDLIKENDYILASLGNYFYSLGELFSKSLKEKVLRIIEKSDLDDLNTLITLRWIECLSVDELKELFNNPSIKLGESLESLLKEVLHNAYDSEEIDLASLANLFYKIHVHIDNEYIFKITEVKDYEGENELKEDFLYYLAVSISKVRNEDADSLIKLLKLIDSEGNFQFVSYEGKKYIASNNNLNLEKKGIEDIDQIKNLSELRNLTLLNLSGNKISEIKGLDNLTKLTRLSLQNNSIKKISGLCNLKNLTYLSLSNNRINEIEGLEGLFNLYELWLNNNSISEIKGLKDLENLGTLELYSNDITELKGLSAQKKLWRLSISENKLAELKGLDSCNNLHTLYLGQNSFTEIKGLQNLMSLESLDLSDSKIIKIEGLESLKNLKYLNLRGNIISKIENLQSLMSLVDIRLAANKISELKGLENLTKLKTISMGKNMISSNIIHQLGGYRSYEEGYVKDAQKFVKYCTEIREKEELRKLKKLEVVQEFEVNKYITIKLEGNVTKIYLKGKMIEYTLRGDFREICSDFQIWSEKNYEMHFFDLKLSFTLLKRLAEEGDPIAKRVFKNEILRRLDTGNITEISNLILDRYLDHLDFEELERYADNLPLLNSFNLLLEKEFLNIYLKGIKEHGR